MEERSMEEWGGAIMDVRSMKEWGGVMYTASEAWRNGVANSTMDSNNGRANHGGMGWCKIYI